jgi:hypothetical protein
MWREQVIAAARRNALIVTWQPIAVAMPAALLFIGLGGPAGAPLRLSIAGCAVAAASGFVLDDPAAATLAPLPRTLLCRRLLRVGVVALAISAWWTAAAFAATRDHGFPLRGRALELGVLVAVGLAASATASINGDRLDGGIVGAVAVGAWYAMSFLPSRRWLPFPGQPDAAGTPARQLLVLGCAIALLWWVSRDPARWPRGRLRTRRRASTPAEFTSP